MSVSHMRFKLLAATASACFISAAAVSPGLLAGSISQVEFCRAAQREVADETFCSGVLSQTDKRDVFLSVPVIADSVLVSPGDSVKKGEPLAIVDTELTRSVLSGSVNVTREPQPENPLAGLSAAEIEAAAAMYGISSEKAMAMVGASGGMPGIMGAAAAPPVESVSVPGQILSPMDGIVTDVSLQSGVLTQTSGAVFTVADGGRWAVSVGVSEDRIAGVREGDGAVITFSAIPGREYAGVVTAISPAAERPSAGVPGSATVNVKMELLNPDEALRGNYSADAVIVSQERELLVTLPYEAIMQDESGAEYVLVYEDGRAQKRVVSTGRELMSAVQIKSGISPEDAVVLGDSGISPGDRISLAGSEGAK